MKEKVKFIKINCLFCNLKIELDQKDPIKICRRCRSQIVLLSNFNGDIHEYLENMIPKEKITELKREKKIRSLILDPEYVVLMYYPHTNTELSRIFTKPTIEALNKILNNKPLKNAERQAIARMRSKTKKVKENFMLNKFMTEFEYPEWGATDQ